MISAKWGHVASAQRCSRFTITPGTNLLLEHSLRDTGLFDFGPVSGKTRLGLLSLLGVFAFKISEMVSRWEKTCWWIAWHSVDLKKPNPNRYQLYESKEQAAVATGRGLGTGRMGAFTGEKGLSGSVSVSRMEHGLPSVETGQNSANCKLLKELCVSLHVNCASLF